MKKKRTARKAAGWVVFLLVLALILLSIFKPEMVGSFLEVLGKGKIRLTSAADRFYDSIDDVVYGFVLPKGEDPNFMTVLKSLGVGVAGIFLNIILGTAISEKLGTSYGTGYLYAYLPSSAVVFLVHGVGSSHLYLTFSIIMLVLTGLFARN